MKREIISLCAIALVGVTIGALGLSNHSSSVKQADEATTKVKKDKSQKKSSKKSVEVDKPKENSQSQEQSSQTTNVGVQQSSQSSSTTNSQSQTQNATAQQQQPQKTQGEINKERGYDPKGNPVMPSQDHAPGSNPDGSADSWVKGQSEWLRQNGLTNPDGTLTQKAKDQRAQEFKNESE